MQLDQYFISFIQISLFDAIVIGTAAAMLVGTIFGIKLKRHESGIFTWIFGGTAAVTIGTLVGYFSMNTVGYIVTWSGSSIHGLTGADLVEWSDTIATSFAPYQMHAAGFAMMGVLFGIGLGYGIGARPDDTSLLGNLIATLGIVAIVAGLLLTIIPGFLTLSYNAAFLYLLLFNGLIVVGYGIASLANQKQEDSPPVEESSEREGPEELIV